MQRFFQDVILDCWLRLCFIRIDKQLIVNQQTQYHCNLFSSYKISTNAYHAFGRDDGIFQQDTDGDRANSSGHRRNQRYFFRD